MDEWRPIAIDHEEMAEAERAWYRAFRWALQQEIRRTLKERDARA